MGEVYKARDTKLGREVAIKVLPEAFSQDKERLARFEREARLLAVQGHRRLHRVPPIVEDDLCRDTASRVDDDRSPKIGDRSVR